MAAASRMRMAASGGLRVRNFTGKCELCKLLGILLVGIGVVVLLFSLPDWLWASLIGITLIVLGVLLLRVK